MLPKLSKKQGSTKGTIDGVINKRQTHLEERRSLKNKICRTSHEASENKDVIEKIKRRSNINEILNKILLNLIEVIYGYRAFHFI